MRWVYLVVMLRSVQTAGAQWRCAVLGRRFFSSPRHIQWKRCCVAWGTGEEEFPFYMLCVDVKRGPDKWKIRHLNSDNCWPYVMEANKHVIVNTFATFQQYIFGLFFQRFRSVRTIKLHDKLYSLSCKRSKVIWKTSLDWNNIQII